MYNFPKYRVEMLEYEHFYKPEWSYYDLGDFEVVLEIFPNLKGYLQKGGFIRGNIGDELSGPELKVLKFESLAVNENFFENIFKQDFPKLQKFEVHIGRDLIHPVENINVFAPLFSGDCFPELTHLRLAGSFIADKIAYNIANVPLIHQLKSLDLSGGLLHTRGAEILVNILPKTNIEKLNLSNKVLDKEFYNSINPMKNKSGRPIEIIIKPQLDEREVLEELDEMDRDIRKWREIV